MKTISILATAVIGCLMLAGCKEKAPEVESPRPVRFIAISEPQALGDMSFTGVISAHTYVKAAFRVSGKIRDRLVGTGTRVQAGQVLAHLDPVLYNDALRAARAQLSDARAALEQATLAHTRARSLVDAQTISRQQYEAAQRNLRSARAQLDGARAAEHKALEELSYTTMTAEVSGMVTDRFFEAGEVVSAGQPVYRIAQEGGFDAVFSVPEKSLASVRSNATVQVCPLSDSSRCVAARIEEVSPEANPATRTHEVKAHISDHCSLALGATVSVHLTSDPTPVWSIPAQALTRTTQGTDAVWIIGEDSTAQLVEVTPTRHQRTDVLIASGLKPGMKVITAGVHVLRQGQPVRE